MPAAWRNCERRSLTSSPEAVSDVYDVIVVGLGGMGSAILAECARRGASALGLDRYPEGHTLGSSTGQSRLFRKAYFEDERYVPLLHRAEELWRRLERESATSLLRTTGLLMVDARGQALLERAAAAAAQHQVPLELLNVGEVRARFPAVVIHDHEKAIFEPGAGVLDPEESMAANLSVADRNNAARRHECQIIGWHEDHDEVVVSAANGSQWRGRKVILALGPWFAQEMKVVGVTLRVQRNVQAWFSPATPAFRFGEFPAFLVERPEWPAPLYGFPDFGAGVKAAFHGGGEFTTPDSLARDVSASDDIVALAKALDSWMPGASEHYLAGKACMYSLTPDENFVIDFHPRARRVILCGGFSGHGFKFAPVIGEIAADLALEGGTRHEIAFLSLNRFLKAR